LHQFDPVGPLQGIAPHPVYLLYAEIGSLAYQALDLPGGEGLLGIHHSGVTICAIGRTFAGALYLKTIWFVAIEAGFLQSRLFGTIIEQSIQCFSAPRQERTSGWGEPLSITV
jgi:hypothetical protein